MKKGLIFPVMLALIAGGAFAQANLSDFKMSTVARDNLLILLVGIISLIILSIILIKKNKFIPTHKVKLLTNAEGLSLRKEPNSTIDAFDKISNGTEIQHISTGGEVKIGEKKGHWFKIKTKEKICGWCFSGSLEKL